MNAPKNRKGLRRKLDSDLERYNFFAQYFKTSAENPEYTAKAKKELIDRNFRYFLKIADELISYYDSENQYSFILNYEDKNKIYSILDDLNKSFSVMYESV